MFSFNSLSLRSPEGLEYEYQFSGGVNYFRGANSTGKTEFYFFLDYMLGSSTQIADKLCFRDSLESATLQLTVNEASLAIRRTLDPEVNYFKYVDEDWANPIGAKEFKEKLNFVFSPEIESLVRLREFIGEDLTYRTFTMFNFLGEKALGYIYDFLDKGKQLKYSLKLTTILGYLFNKNLPDIETLKAELFSLQKEVAEIEVRKTRTDFIVGKVNENLPKLNISKVFTGRNASEIAAELELIRTTLQPTKVPTKKKNAVELESIYNNIVDQIKIYENAVTDNKHFQAENRNKVQLLSRLKEMTDELPHLSYLTESIVHLTDDLNKSISFNNYVINNQTIKELRAQLQLVRNELRMENSRFEYFDISDKLKSATLVEELISQEVGVDVAGLVEKQNRILELKRQIKALQNSDDSAKITLLSNYITELYSSAKDVSDVVASDFQNQGFRIRYGKKGNVLQPFVLSQDGTGVEEPYYSGSMARHTLIQLCGYLGFLKLLIEEARFPLVPILVVDHISKPFDATNRKAIGKILSTFLEMVPVGALQIVMFDDENHEDLLIDAGHSENLVTNEKSGFNPFYSENSDEDAKI